MIIKIKGMSYVAGYDKQNGGSSHLYRGTFENPGEPMCAQGWNRADGTDYSIVRGEAPNGVCRECWGNAKERKSTIPRRSAMKDKDNKELQERHEQANREARSIKTSTSLQGTVQNPAGAVSADEPDTGASSVGSGLTGASSDTFGGQTVTEQPSGANRTTRETGDRVTR